MHIHSVHAREILDSRGYPTVEVDVTLNTGALGRFAVPSGASTGEHEALELRDGDTRRYLGKGVLKAVSHVNEIIASELARQTIQTQQALDACLLQLDGTSNKARLGANAILGVSVAAAKAFAEAQKKTLYQALSHTSPTLLPTPLMNVINGGMHADNPLAIQEFMIVPVGAPSFKEALRAGAEVFHHLKKRLKAQNFVTSVGDEGGYAPHLPHTVAALEMLHEAINAAGYKPQQEIALALDAAASSFYDLQTSIYNIDGKKMDRSEMIQWWKKLVDDFSIVSIEDPLDENDWIGFSELTQLIGHRTQIVGDDLFVTNAALVKKGISLKAANAVLIKLNQIGTLSETLETITLAQQSGYGVILSHRSGETGDTTIADLSVATQAGQIKTGSLSRSDRVSKYNQLLRIEEELGSHARYLGGKVFKQI